MCRLMLVLVLAGCVSVAVAQLCLRGSDCNPGECCVIDKINQSCQPFKRAGEGCHIYSSLLPGVQPEGPVVECPCEADTSCVPLNPINAPDEGKRGTCESLLAS